MKQVMDFLRKIGFLHVSSGDYQTGEFDSRKDLKKKKGSAGGAKQVNKKISGKKGMLLFWIMLVITGLFLLSVLVSYGFRFWLLIMLVAWFFFFRFLHKQILAGKLKIAKIIIIYVVLFIFSLIFLVPSNDSSSGGSLNDSSSGIEKSGALEVNQANFSSFIFGSDSSGGHKTDTVHLTINPLIMFSVSGGEAELKSFEIKNLKFSKKPKVGEVKIVAPKHRKADESCTGFYFDGCDGRTKPEEVKNNGGNIKYEVVDIESPKEGYYDQVGSSFYINPNFRVIVHNIGGFDYDKIMKKNGSVNGSMYAKYAGIEASDLASTLEFDILATLTDGEKYKQHFVVKFDGNDLLNGKTVTAEY